MCDGISHKLQGWNSNPGPSDSEPHASRFLLLLRWSVDVNPPLHSAASLDDPRMGPALLGFQRQDWGSDLCWGRCALFLL